MGALSPIAEIVDCDGLGPSHLGASTARYKVRIRVHVANLSWSARCALRAQLAPCRALVGGSHLVKREGVSRFSACFSIAT